MSSLNTIRQYQVTLAYAFAFLLLLSNAALADDRTTLDNPQVLIIEGLSLEDVSRTGVEQVFGKAGSERFSEGSGSEKICYTNSHGGDDTIEFELGEVGSGFRLFHATAGQRGHCHESSKVNRNLTTGIGLKLGLSKAEVEAILGKPNRSEKQVAIWEGSKARPLTSKEIARFKSATPSATPPSTLDLSTRITIHFVNSHATSIEISHSEST